MNKKHIQIIINLGKIATDLGYNAYVVGGFVRDFFTDSKSKDIDIVIEGNGITFAKKYATRTNSKIQTYKKFHTATIIMQNNIKIDIASARIEYYKFPASLPTVKMSSIKMDLYRRDFTINTLAVQINSKKFGCLIDFFSGQQDIKNKTIKVLHNMSFVEDPTRIFRALRFEQRLNFNIDNFTIDLIHNAVKMNFFKHLSNQRIFTELKLILKEKNPIPIIMKLFEYNILKTIHSEKENKKKLKKIMTKAKFIIGCHNLLMLQKTDCNYWAIYFMIIIRNCNKNKSVNLCEKMAIQKKYKKMFCITRFEAINQLHYLEEIKQISNSKIVDILSKFQPEILLFMIINSKSKKTINLILNYQNKLHNTKIKTLGSDILNLGIKPGPKYNNLMKKILEAKLDGHIKSKKDEIFLLKIIINS